LREVPRRDGRWYRTKALKAGTQVAKIAISSSIVDQLRGDTTFPGILLAANLIKLDDAVRVGKDWKETFWRMIIATKDRRII
jgi:hypothetical protein